MKEGYTNLSEEGRYGSLRFFASALQWG